MNVDWQVTIGADDQAAGYTLAGATISYGRADYWTQPDPATLNAELLAVHAPVPALGDPVTVDALIPAAGGPVSSRRFTGRVAGVRAGGGLYRVTATGRAETVNRVMAGDQPWPVETDVARLTRILGLAPVPSRVVGTSRVSFVARDVDVSTLRSAGELARDYATLAGGLLGEDRDGTVVFWTAAALAKPARVFTVPADLVTVDDFELTLHAGGVVNQVRVGYGPPVDTGTGTGQATVYVQDQASIDAYGPRYLYAGTDLWETYDAEHYAGMILANRAHPAWQLPTVNVELHLTDDPALLELLAGIATGDMLFVPGAPPGAPVPDYTGLVQGWVEECSPTLWRIDFQVIRNDTVPLGTVTWEEPGPTYTWAKQTAAWSQAVTIDDLIGA